MSDPAATDAPAGRRFPGWAAALALALVAAGGVLLAVWAAGAQRPRAPIPAPLAAAPAPPTPIHRPAHAPAPAEDPYATAMRELACGQRAEELAAQVALGDALATAAAEQRRAEACADGVATPSQIEAALRSAAARGDPDAQRQLLDERAGRLLRPAVAAAPPGQRPRLSATDERQLAAIVGELELLALRGQRASIESLAQLVESPVLAAPDRAYAAAWRLAARQDPTRPFPAADAVAGREELLDGLDEDQRRQALALAPELFADCCRRR